MNKYWERLSAREQRLALITAGLVAVAVCFGVSYRALSVLGDLDFRIAQLEQDLLNMVRQDARRVSVGRAFLKVAAVHSSEWTEQEIHDRLRREVYRLALLDPPAEDSETLATNVSQKDYLVQIPRLREGTLKEEGDGYREYQISLRLPGTGFLNVLTFLERLQSSRQVLRIDSLELARAPQSEEIVATIEVTRTVVDNPDEESMILSPWSNRIANSGFEEWDDAKHRFTSWETPGCEIAPATEYATAGSSCLAGSSQNGDGRVYQVRELECDRTYKLEVDITSFSPMWLSVQDEEHQSSLTGKQEVVGDGKTYRYELDFTPSGGFGERRRIRVPVIEARAENTTFFVDRVILTMLEE